MGDGTLARVMIVGGGARSHALAEALMQSPTVGRVVLAPGTTGLEELGFETAPVSSQDFKGLAEYALFEEIDLTVVGPNTPLVDGIVDHFEAEGLRIFGPSKQAARLEGSKVFARLLMNRLQIPTPRFAICDTMERAARMAQTTAWARVYKADGIAYGKGVRVTRTASEAEAALETVMQDNIYGLESERIVVEERLDGTEITVFSLTDGEDVVLLGNVQNHPRLYDGDEGPPTRGMGQISPSPLVDESLEQEIKNEILRPTIQALADAGTPLRGALFVDLMVVPEGVRVIDYNVRFGDPATQTLLSAYTGDVYGLLGACLDGGLPAAATRLKRDRRPRVSVVIAAEGYPDERVRGHEIKIDTDVFASDPDLWLFQDGVRARESILETTGGRTFTVVAAGSTVAEARQSAYRAVKAIHFEGMHYRADIGIFSG